MKMMGILATFVLWVCASALGSAVALLLNNRHRARQLREIERKTDELLQARAFFMSEMTAVAETLAKTAAEHGDLDFAENFRRLGKLTKPGVSN